MFYFPINPSPDEKAEEGVTESIAAKLRQELY